MPGTTSLSSRDCWDLLCDAVPHGQLQQTTCRSLWPALGCGSFGLQNFCWDSTVSCAWHHQSRPCGWKSTWGPLQCASTSQREEAPSSAAPSRSHSPGCRNRTSCHGGRVRARGWFRRGHNTSGNLFPGRSAALEKPPNRNWAPDRHLLLFHK